KKHLIDALQSTLKINSAVIHCLNGLQYNKNRCEKSLINEVFATHKAVQSVLEGSNFRDAYQQSTTTDESELESHKSKLKNSYQVVGFPGNPATEYYINKINSYQQWLDD